MFTIIVPLDGSERSEQALPAAIRLARSTGGVVQLVHVLENDAFLELAPSGSAPPIAEAEQYLLRTQRQLPPDIHSSTCLTSGKPDNEILAIASRSPNPIIVMSTHGRGAFGRMVTGSVADRVIRNGKFPVAVVRRRTPASPPTIRNIVVALDGSKFAESSLPLAVEIARESGAILALVRVVEPVALHSVATYPAGASYVPYEELIQLEEQILADARAYLDRIAQEIRAQGVRVVWELRTGRPADEILRMAETTSADLLLTTTHSRGGLQRLALGSVTSDLIRKGNVPVLNVPPTPEDAPSHGDQFEIVTSS